VVFRDALRRVEYVTSNYLSSCCRIFNSHALAFDSGSHAHYPARMSTLVTVLQLVCWCGALTLFCSGSFQPLQRIRMRSALRRPRLITASPSLSKYLSLTVSYPFHVLNWRSTKARVCNLCVISYGALSDSFRTLIVTAHDVWWVQDKPYLPWLVRPKSIATKIFSSIRRYP